MGQKYHGNRRFLIPKSVLWKMRRAQRMTRREIAAWHFETLGVKIAPQTVSKYLAKWGIECPAPVPPPVGTVKETRTQTLVYFPAHPQADRYGWVRLAIVRVEEKFGRTYRPRREVIRYLDGNARNCDPANLDLVPVKRGRNRKKRLLELLAAPPGSTSLFRVLKTWPEGVRYRLVRWALAGVVRRFRQGVMPTFQERRLFWMANNRMLGLRPPNFRMVPIKLLAYVGVWSWSDRLWVIIDCEKVEAAIVKRQVSIRRFCKRTKIDYVTWFQQRGKRFRVVRKLWLKRWGTYLHTARFNLVARLPDMRLFYFGQETFAKSGATGSEFSTAEKRKEQYDKETIFRRFGRLTSTPVASRLKPEAVP